MCRCVSSTSMRRTEGSIVAAMRRIPVPASSTRTLPSCPRTATHDVLPPYPAVSGPGVASEPRVPHNCTTISDLPEDPHHAQQPFGLADERERGDLQVSPSAVAGARPYRPRNGPALETCHPC